MSVQTVFKRYELKYMMTLEQKEKVLAAMREYMTLDEYGRTTIRNIYFDTYNYRLARQSIEKPIYKEKLRVRSYSQATANSTVFVELKKKYDSVVYKRRLVLEEQNAMNWIETKNPGGLDSQISREINYFLDYYENLMPAVFLSYEREAFYSNDHSDFRVTFDDTILFREEDVSLKSPVWGTPILEDGWTLMELKCSAGIPMWMAAVLAENGIYKTSFSKYGTAYTDYILPNIYKRIFIPNMISKEILNYA